MVLFVTASKRDERASLAVVIILRLMLQWKNKFDSGGNHAAVVARN